MSVDIDALEALLAKATPAPWRILRDECEEGDDGEEEPTVVRYLDPEGSLGIVCETTHHSDGDERDETNARLIAALRNAAPDLLAIARAAQRLADCAAAVVVYHDDMPKCGTDQRPDLGVRIARLNAALDGYDNAAGATTLTPPAAQGSE